MPYNDYTKFVRETLLFIRRMFIMNEKKMINLIKVVLAEKNKTNKWLAENIGKTENTISRWCNNKMQPGAEVCTEIAEALDVDVRELFNKTKE